MHGKQVAASVTIACLVLLAGCSASSSTTQPTTARATVEAYYSAAGAHDWGHAEALLTPSLRTTFRNAVEHGRILRESSSHFNVISVSAAPSQASSFPGYVDIQRATLSYDARYDNANAALDGPKKVTIYVGRSAASGNWELLGPDPALR